MILIPKLSGIYRFVSCDWFGRYQQLCSKSADCPLGPLFRSRDREKSFAGQSPPLSIDIAFA